MKSLSPRNFWVKKKKKQQTNQKQNHNKTYVWVLENNKTIANQAGVVVNQNFTKPKLLLIIIIVILAYGTLIIIC